MKKTFSYALAAVMTLTLLLSGCGSNNKDNAAQNNTPANTSGSGANASNEDIIKKHPGGQMIISPQLIGYQEAQVGCVLVRILLNAFMCLGESAIECLG